MGPQAAGFIGNHGLWVDLVRVPPSGTWERRRADRLALAEQWVGPEDATEAEGRRHLVEAYLRAFGPAPWADIGTWAGVPVTALRAAGADLPLSRLQDEQGRELVDLSGLPIADRDVPTPVRFLPTWEALLLVHARRTLVLPEEHRTRIFSSRTRSPWARCSSAARSRRRGRRETGSSAWSRYDRWTWPSGMRWRRSGRPSRRSIADPCAVAAGTASLMS